MRVVLDTNVLVSALLETGGHPSRILRVWREKRYALVTSDKLIAELRRAIQPVEPAWRFDPMKANWQTRTYRVGLALSSATTSCRALAGLRG